MKSINSLTKVNKLPLRNGYSIINTVYTKASEKHIPYIVGCVIEGPKGGTYAVDCFGLQILFERANIEIFQGTAVTIVDTQDRALESPCLIGVEMFTESKTNEDAMKAYAKKEGHTYIKRNNAYDFISKMI